MRLKLHGFQVIFRAPFGKYCHRDANPNSINRRAVYVSRQKLGYGTKCFMVSFEQIHDDPREEHLYPRKDDKMSTSSMQRDLHLRARGQLRHQEVPAPRPRRPCPTAARVPRSCGRRHTESPRLPRSWDASEARQAKAGKVRLLRGVAASDPSPSLAASPQPPALAPSAFRQRASSPQAALP